MTYIVYLMLLVGIEPYPQFMLLSDFDTMSQCASYVKSLKLKEKDTSQMFCVPVITSPMTDPI